MFEFEFVVIYCGVYLYKKADHKERNVYFLLSVKLTFQMDFPIIPPIVSDTYRPSLYGHTATINIKIPSTRVLRHT